MTPGRVRVNACCIVIVHRLTTSTYWQTAEAWRVQEWSVSWMTKQGTVAMCNFANDTVITIMKDCRCKVIFSQFIYTVRKLLCTCFKFLIFYKQARQWAANSRHETSLQRIIVTSMKTNIQSNYHDSLQARLIAGICIYISIFIQ